MVRIQMQVIGGDAGQCQQNVRLEDQDRTDLSVDDLGTLDEAAPMKDSFKSLAVTAYLSIAPPGLIMFPFRRWILPCRSYGGGRARRSFAGSVLTCQVDPMLAEAAAALSASLFAVWLQRVLGTVLA